MTIERMVPLRFSGPERGLCVEVSEDGSGVVMRLDRDHAAELARIISSMSIDGHRHDSWLSLARGTTSDTWLETMNRLVACSQGPQANASGVQGRV